MFDDLFERSYNKRNYNCAHFSCEVWFRLTGEDVTHKLRGFLAARENRKVLVSLRHDFKQVSKNEQPAIALMQRIGYDPHVGILVNDKIIHIHECGVEFMPIDVATRGFKKVRYFK